MDTSSSSSTPPSLPAAASSPCSPRLAPDQHAAQAGETSAPMEISETSAPRPAAPAALLPRPARRLMKPPFTVEAIFRSFTMRRVALIRALTTDEEAFFQKCEPGMPVLYLFGNTDGSWEVKRPVKYVPHSQPEPAVGINKARDKMKRHKWLQEVARHCDAWLMSISFYYGSYLTAGQREFLFSMINSVPTVQETFLASNTYQRIRHLEEKGSSDQENKEEEDVLPGEDKNFCASCGDHYHANAFWISCNVCERWYHGKCVKIKASEAENIDHYECPECRSEKIGHDYDEDPELSYLFKRY